MTKMEVTKFIIKKAYEFGFEVDANFSVFNNGDDPIQPMIQINLKSEKYKDFAFFYAMYDFALNYSCCFLVYDNKDSKALELFEENPGIFGEYNLNDDYNMIELFNALEFDAVTEEDICKIFEYLTQENELNTYLNAISNGKEFNREKDVVTNEIFKQLYQMGLDFELLLEIEEENLESVLIQINVLCDNINSFAFFYGTLDNEINYSSIFEVNDCHDENVLDLFNKNKGIFQDLLVESETNTIHLYSKIDKEEVTEEVIQNILKYLTEEHEVIEYIKTIQL